MYLFSRDYRSLHILRQKSRVPTFDQSILRIFEKRGQNFSGHLYCGRFENRYFLQLYSLDKQQFPSRAEHR